MPAYAQLVLQVRRAVLRGVLVPGDRLPTAREVVASLAINPNTVLKAYTQLEHEGIVYSRPGLGTFIADTAPAPVPATEQRRLGPALESWVERARAAGLSGEAVWSLVDSAIENAYGPGALRPRVPPGDADQVT
jgi:GntR family transcriptional regulator